MSLVALWGRKRPSGSKYHNIATKRDSETSFSPMPFQSRPDSLISNTSSNDDGPPERQSSVRYNTANRQFYGPPPRATMERGFNSTFPPQNIPPPGPDYKWTGRGWIYAPNQMPNVSMNRGGGGYASMNRHPPPPHIGTMNRSGSIPRPPTASRGTVPRSPPIGQPLSRTPQGDDQSYVYWVSVVGFGRVFT